MRLLRLLIGFMAVSFVLILAAAASGGAKPPTSFASADSDLDGVSDIAEANCGGNPNNSRRRPERTDDVFAGRDENGNGQVDEALPGGSSGFDCDGDGYTGAAEASIFSVSGRDQDACGTSAWPSDLFSGGGSGNRVNIQDLTSFVGPTYRLNTDQGNPGYDSRWDLVPGPGLFSHDINIQDLTALVGGATGVPPMLSGHKAYDGRHCPWPLTTGSAISNTIPNTTQFADISELTVIPGQPDEAVVLLHKIRKAYRISLSGAFSPVLFGDFTSVAGGDLGEEGLTALAFPPNYPSDSRVYVCYTTGYPNPTFMSRFNVTGGQVNISSKEELIQLTTHTEGIHNCGQLLFGSDGYLWMSAGDGGPGGDPSGNGQNINSLSGKVLRLNVSGATGYTSPADNPFVGVSGRDEIWSFGFRNPWRFSFDDETHEVWLGDVGQSDWEEVDGALVKGGNYGWVCKEGFSNFNPGATGCAGATFQWPRLVYDHVNDGCAVIGGWVYHGSNFPELAGWYIYADYCLGRIWAVNSADSVSDPVKLIDSTFPITSIAELPGGEIAFTTETHGVLVLTRS